MINTSPSIIRGILLLFIIAVLTGCEKDDPSTEASIEVVMNLNTNAAMQGKLTIEQAFATAMQIEMVAKRTDGTQFTFSQENTAEDKEINLLSQNANAFNIPAQQGKYDPIEITLTLQPDPYQLKVTSGTEGNPPTVDFADFLQNANPSLLFAGKFNNRGASTKVYVSLNIGDRIKAQATQTSTSAVALSKENRAKFSFDPAYILQDLTTADLEGAITFDYLGNPTILIHQDFNADLYELILERMFEDQQSLKVDIVQIGSKG
jgi:hypothetical protein